MPPSRDRGQYLDGVIVVFLFATFLLVPPFFDAWATPDAPWYLPYLVWLGIIVLIALIQTMRKRHGL